MRRKRILVFNLCWPRAKRARKGRGGDMGGPIWQNLQPSSAQCACPCPHSAFGAYSANEGFLHVRSALSPLSLLDSKRHLLFYCQYYSTKWIIQVGFTTQSGIQEARSGPNEVRFVG